MPTPQVAYILRACLCWSSRRFTGRHLSTALHCWPPRSSTWRYSNFSRHNIRVFSHPTPSLYTYIPPECVATFAQALKADVNPQKITSLGTYTHVHGIVQTLVQLLTLPFNIGIWVSNFLILCIHYKLCFFDFVFPCFGGLE